MPGNLPLHSDELDQSVVDAYQHAMADLRLSENGKQALIERITRTCEQSISKKDSETRQPSIGRRVRRITLGILVAAALVMAGVASAGVSRVTEEDLLVRAFGADYGDAEVSGLADDHAEARASSDGYTLSVDSVVADSSRILIGFTLSHDGIWPFQGGPVSDPAFDVANMQFGDWQVEVGATGQYEADGLRLAFFDKEPSDSSIQAMLSIDLHEALPLSGETCEARFHADGLSCQSAQGERVVISTGAWDLSCQFAYAVDHVDFKTGRRTSNSGLTAALDKAVLTPMSLRLEYTVAETGNVSGEKLSAEDAERIVRERGVQRLLCFYDPLFIRFEDGTKLIAPVSGATSRVDASGGRLKCYVNVGLDRVVDVGKVAYLRLGDISVHPAG